MRVIDQVSWIGRLHGVDRRTAAARAQRLLDQLGLGDRARDKIMDLSGGMAQRVQLAAAMVHEPELLVLDEPFAGLDPVAVQFLSEVITEHVEAGRNLLLSSHQLDLVEDLCETITLVDHGRVVLQGNVRALKEASPNRLLRVDVPVDPSWLDHDATVERIDASGTRMRLRHGADPGAVLDLVRSHVAVRDFGVESPSLSELFLEAAGHPALEPGPAAEPHSDRRDGGGASLLGRLTGGRAR
jgi:ABC-2 type transport system ATP-binding protein